MPADLPKEGMVARLTGQGGPFLLEDIRLPELQPGEALLKVETCTICASDLRTFRGERAAPSSGLLGHEVVGRIVAVGSDDSLSDIDDVDLGVGDRVICGVAASCGACRYCVRGIPQKCMALKKLGHADADDRWQFSGGFAEYLQLPVGSVLARLPESFTGRQAAWLGCAGATAAAATRTAGELRDRTVLVAGSGAVGLFVALLAVESGAQVLVVDPREERLELANGVGATSTHLLRLQDTEAHKNEALKDFVMDSTDHRGADVVFETSGSNTSVAAALSVTDIGGRVILAGSVAPSDPIALQPEKVVTSLLRIEGIHNYTPWDLATAVGSAVANPFLLNEVASHFPGVRLGEINAAFELALSGSNLRVAVEP